MSAMTLDDAIYDALLREPSTYAELQVRLQEMRLKDTTTPYANPGQLRRSVKRLEQRGLITHGWRDRQKLWFVTDTAKEYKK